MTEMDVLIQNHYRKHLIANKLKPNLVPLY